MIIENFANVLKGTCASTCTVFAEMMKSQAKVKSVVMGGRKQYGPMQGVGGVKGANVYDFGYISQLVHSAFADSSPARYRYLNATYGAIVPAAAQAILRVPLSSEGGSQARVNIRNNIRIGDESETPLQFVYEAADCRLFYTAPMITQQQLVWDAAYKAMWGNGSCVKGSTNQPSSLSGSLLGQIDDAEPAGMNYTVGGNGTATWPSGLPNNATISLATPTASASGGASTFSPTAATTEPPAATTSGPSAATYTGGAAGTKAQGLSIALGAALAGALLL